MSRRTPHILCARTRSIMRFAAIGVLLALVGGRSAAAAPAGTMQKVPFASQALGQTRSIYVYTPHGYQAGSARRYPVLVFLHGAPGEASDWIYKGHIQTYLDAAIATGALPPCIAVLANGKGPFYKGGSEWADSFDGRCRMDTCTAVDLPKFLAGRYETSPDPQLWALCGVSEGAYGAANLVVRHPDRFRNALVLSGDFAVSEDWPDARAVFGEVPAYWRQNSPVQQLERVAPAERRQMRFYVLVGEGDAEAVDAALAFNAVCRRLDVTVRLDQDPGKHDWSVWRAHLPEALATLGRWWKDGQR